MSGLIDSTCVHYGVIKGCCSQSFPERLVIAYADEKSLRDLIAAPSILGLGFDSRAAAVTSARDKSAAIVFSKQIHERPEITDRGQKCELKAASTRPGLAGRFRSHRIREIAQHALQRSLVMIVILLYSGNIASAMIRSTLGFPC